MYWVLNSQIGKTPVDVKIPDHSTSFEKKVQGIGRSSQSLGKHI